MEDEDNREGDCVLCARLSVSGGWVSSKLPPIGEGLVLSWWLHGSPMWSKAAQSEVARRLKLDASVAPDEWST